MEENLPENTEERVSNALIEKELKSSFLDYAMSVIVSRALPDAKDGLKPVHRRILYSMYDMGLQYNKPFKKSARIVGEVLGKYHPHGDSAVYESLVRMAQDFSLRYTLINGQGNFGSVDGDRPAAMRYTEARLMKISSELIQDIEKETVEFRPNFDNSLEEPSVLPSKIPNLLINGSSGIAVGMATNIPPHNLTDVCRAVIKMIEQPDVEIEELISIIQAPDFPTGGLLCGTAGVTHAYHTGKGKVRIRARTNIEEKKNKSTIIVTEIPYMLNKSILLKQIADLVKTKVVQGISELRDESDRNGMRIVIELKRDANPEIVLNQLYKHSRLESTSGVMFLALVDNVPKILNLKELIKVFLDHRFSIVTKRTQFDLKKAEERAHILQGLIIALDSIDSVIKTIRNSDSVETAKSSLIQNYELTEIQAKAILEMRLQKLASLEQEKIKNEYKNLQEVIRKLKAILDSDDEIFKIIKAELEEMQQKYGDHRKTSIIDYEEDIDIEDLIEEEDVVVTISHSGYVKRISLKEYKQQGRGGKGVIAQDTKEEDFLEHIFIANTHSYLLIFTDKGKVHWLKVYKIPEAGRYSKGKAIVNLLALEKDENISAYIPIKEFDEGHYLMFATRKGIVKKTKLKDYSRPRAGGIKAILIDDDDDVIGVVMTDGQKKIMLATSDGQAVKFDESNVRPMGRATRGVIGIRLKSKTDSVVGMVIAEEDKTLLTVTENGFGKRTPISDYRLITRGGSGVINIQTTDRNGKVAAIKCIEDGDELMFISVQGQVIRTSSKFISVIGRNTQGVRLMRMNQGDKVSDAAKIISE